MLHVFVDVVCMGRGGGVFGELSIYIYIYK